MIIKDQPGFTTTSDEKQTCAGLLIKMGYSVSLSKIRKEPGKPNMSLIIRAEEPTKGDSED